MGVKEEESLNGHSMTAPCESLYRPIIHLHQPGLRRDKTPVSDPFLSLGITRGGDAARSTISNPPCEDMEGGTIVQFMATSAPQHEERHVCFRQRLIDAYIP